MSGWYCVGCGLARRIDDFGQPCECGAYAIACDEHHLFTLAQLRELAEREEVSPIEGPH